MRYIYEITNLINGKTYYGQRKLKEGRTWETDTYRGSGKLLNLAYQKYGRKNFKRKCLLIGDFSQKEIDRFEICIIRQMKFLGKAEYNIAKGGLAGNLICYMSKEQLSKIYTKERRKKMSDVTKKKFENKDYREKMIRILHEHRWDSTGTHPKMPIGHGQNEKNSQFGTHWYNNGKEDIKAKECPIGFVKGRLHGMPNCKGTQISLETKRKISEKLKGRHLSEETKQKLSILAKNQKKINGKFC